MSHYFVLIGILVILFQNSPHAPENRANFEESNPFTGREYALHFRAVDPEDVTAVNVAASMTAYRWSVYFETDSTYIRNSPRYMTPGRWRAFGDSVEYAGARYLVERIGGRVYWRDSVFRIELRPL